MSNTNQLRWGTILSYLQMALGTIIGLAYTPIMIRLLGKSEYGLYNTVSSTIAMLSILSLGFGSGYIRYYSQYKQKDDQESISKLNGLFLIVFIIIGLTALACGLFLTFHLELVFKEGLTSGEYRIARILMLLLSINLAFSFPGSVFSSIITAHERFIFIKLAGMLYSLLGPLITLPLLLLGYRSVAMVTVSVIVSFIYFGLQIYYVFFVLNQTFVFRDFEKGIFKSIFSYTIFIALNIIVDQINTNIDNLLLTRFKGTAEVSLYAAGMSIYHHYQRLSTSVSNVFTPRIHGIVSRLKDDQLQLRHDLTDLFVRVGRVQFIIISLVASGFVFFGKSFIENIWAGEGYTNSYYVALLLMIPAIVPLTQNLGIEIQRAQNLHHFRSIFYSCMALINLTISVFLCQLYGAVGSATGTAIATVVATGIAMNIYYHRRCNVDILVFWKNILRMSFGLVPAIVFGICYCTFVNINRVYLMLIGIALYTTVFGVSFWLISMNSFEKGIIRSAWRKVRKV